MSQMYRATTSGGGDSAWELAPPGQFHRRLAPESEIERDLSEPGFPTDVRSIEKGSGMSVPVVPRFDTSDTAGAASASYSASSVNVLSDLEGAPRAWFPSLDDLSALGMPVPSMETPRTPYRSGGKTYVVRRQDWVKIGRSTDVRTRMVALAAPQPGVICPDGMDLAAPLQLICTIPANVERELHERYAAHHAAGEWFVADAAMLAEIADLAERRAV